MTDSNYDIIAHKIKDGDEKAFGAFFDQFYISLCKYAYGYVQDYEQSEEIVQGAFVKLWEERSRIDPLQSIKSYAFRIVGNQSLNYLKHLKVRSKYQQYVMDTGMDSFGLPSEFDVFDKVNEAVSELPVQCRKVFELSRFDGLTHKEIAQELGCSQKTVEGHMNKALKRLRTSLRDFLFIVIILNFLWG